MIIIFCFLFLILILLKEFFPPSLLYFAPFLYNFSNIRITKTNIIKNEDNFKALAISFIPNHDLKIPIVNVDIPKYSTAAVNGLVNGWLQIGVAHMAGGWDDTISIRTNNKSRRSG